MKKPKKLKPVASAELPKDVQCFYIVPTGYSRVRLRRFRSGEQTERCSAPHGYHDAWTNELARVPDEVAKTLDGDFTKYPKTDPRWPTHCPCGYAFTDDDYWQTWTESVFTHGGKEYFLREPVPGMMYDADWLHDHKDWVGPDGRSLHVICPDGHGWCIDSRASNCTMKDDHEHKCWVRHGEPPLITVDKAGKTCKAGAGSIQTPTYHGHLTNGRFRP